MELNAEAGEPKRADLQPPRVDQPSNCSVALAKVTSSAQFS